MQARSLLCILIAVSLFSTTTWGTSIKVEEQMKSLFTTELKVTGKINVIGNNDAAFKAKISAVKAAEDTLDLSYFIYSDDESTSYFSETLLEATLKKDLKVRLLVDYHANYKNFAMFSALETLSNGKIKVRFFNRPTVSIIKDAIYMTSTCKDADMGEEACAADKNERIEQVFSGLSQKEALNVSMANSAIFLSGLYAKDTDLMAYAVLTGQRIDLAELSSGPKTSEEDKENAKKLTKLYLRSKLSKSKIERVSAHFKLSIASLIYGDKVSNFINTIQSATPFGRQLTRENRTQDWEYLTDYTHHKVLLADKKTLITGGRNMENSYHMKPNTLTKKYIFMDTDTSISLAQGGDAVAESFSRIWNDRTRVASTEDVRSHAPNTLLAHKKIYAGVCKNKVEPLKCVLEKMTDKTKSPLQLDAKAWQKIAANSAIYQHAYQISPRKSPGDFTIRAKAPNNAVIGYLENLPYKKASAERAYGAAPDDRTSSSKMIQEAWEQSLRRTCAMSSAKQPQDIIFHNAYVFPSGNFIKLLADAVDGTIRCQGVSIKILTNSIDSTDLKPVNQFTRYQMKAFYDYYAQVKREMKHAKLNGATFTYYEYLAQKVNNSSFSLHSKVSLFGDTLIIGSANLDIRSYMMDTNNAVYIQGATSIVEPYKSYIDNMIKQGLVRSIDKRFASAQIPQLMTEDAAGLDATIKQYDPQGKIDATTIESLKTKVLDLAKATYTVSADLLNIKLTLVSQKKTLSSRKHKKLKAQLYEEIDQLNREYKLL